MSTAMRDGVLRIERHEDWLLRDCARAAPSTDRPHPGWTIVGGFSGLGAGLVGLFGMIGAEFKDGVMFGECDVEQIRPLEYETDYRVTCLIEGTARRTGRRVAVFDVVDYVVEIHDDEGIAVRNRNSFVVPRAEAGA